jgi:4-hydroxybenzoate polyprenyltransferase
VNQLIGYLRLARLANIVTAISDILAGVTIAAALSVTAIEPEPIMFLILATVGLYGGGVVFNDVFDAELDRIERPERPIPSGLISTWEASVFGGVLLVGGIMSAMFVSIFPTGLLALAIAVAALIYDKWGKHHAIAGPLNMGLCRGLNLVLGMSLGGIEILDIVYIGAITMISRGEVHGGKSATMVWAAMLYAIVIGSISYAAYRYFNLLYTALFLLAFALLIYPSLIRAMRDPSGKNIGKAVKAGILALIVMNASWAAAFGSLYTALFILLLLPLSIFLARLFAVT